MRRRIKYKCRWLLVSSTGYTHIPQYATLPLPFLWAASSQGCIIITDRHIFAFLSHHRKLHRTDFIAPSSPKIQTVSKVEIFAESTVELLICRTLPDFMTQWLCSYAYAACLSWFGCSYIEKP